MADKKSQVWISKLVELEIKQKYRALVDVSWFHRAWAKLQNTVPGTVFIALVLFLCFWGINELCISQGWILATYSHTAESTSDILASLLEYISAITGIVIPVVLLIVEFVGREASSVIDVYLDKLGIKKTTAFVLSILGVETLAIWGSRAGIISNPTSLFYGTCLLILLNLAALWETWQVIRKLRDSTSTVFLTNALMTALKKEVVKSQKEQVKYRLGQLAHVNLCNTLNLDTKSIAKPQNTIAILSPVSGVIQDVHITRFRRFAENLQGHIQDKPLSRACVVQFIGNSVIEGTPLAYVHMENTEHFESLREMLLRSVRIKVTPRKGGEIERLLSQVKQITESAIRYSNEELLINILDVYLYIFELSKELPPPPPSVTLPFGPFQGWYVTTLAISHLRDFVEVAAAIENYKPLSQISYTIVQIAKSMIAYANIYVNESFQNVLDLFSTLYLVAKKHENEYGITVSSRDLTGELIQKWTITLKDSIDDSQAVKNLYEVLTIILGTLSNLVREAIDQSDASTLETLLSQMKPDELLAYYHLIGSLHQRRFQLSYTLRYTPEDVLPDTEEQLRRLTVITNIPTDVKEFFAQLIFVISSYILDCYNKNVLNADNTKSLLRVIKPYWGSFSQCLSLFIKLIDTRSPLDWELFNRQPDTKRVDWENSESKFYLFYCLFGIIALADEQDTKHPNIPLSQHQLIQIEAISKQIATSAQIWSDILEISSSLLAEKAEEFINLNKQMNKIWQDKQEEQITKASLDSSKLDAFEESLTDAFCTHVGLSRLLGHYGRVEESDKVNGARSFQIKRRGEKRFFTTLHPDLEFSSQLGKQYGAQLANSVERYVLKTWIAKGYTLSSRKDWNTLAPYFERALSRFEKTGLRATLILLPIDLQWETLNHTPGFVNRYEISSEERAELQGLDIRGFYKQIPIAQWLDADTYPHILVVDLENAGRLFLEKPKASIYPLSESDFEQIQTKYPEQTREELELSVFAEARVKAKFTSLNKAILKFKLRLPEEAFYPPKLQSMTKG